MEPDHLKSLSSGEDALETWLRTNADLPPLPDAGFSGRVLAALPPPQRSQFSPRILVCLTGALAGVLVAVGPAFAAGNPLDRLPALDAALLAAFLQLTHPSTVLALGATIVSLLFAFRSELRRLVRW
jgi:hypothetical protein